MTTCTLQALPSNTRSRVCFEAFDHLVTTIKSLILSDSLKFITIPALATLEKDVLFLDKYVSNLEDFTAADAFVELRQV